MEDHSTNISSTKKYFRFENIALIMGFIVDSITITAILLSLSLPDTKLILPQVVTPGLAFIVWLLAVYIYLAYLHHYWESQVTPEKFANKFGMFILNDLVYGFRKPWQLFPLFILLIVRVQDIVNTSRHSFYLGEGSAHREHSTGKHAKKLVFSRVLLGFYCTQNLSLANWFTMS